MEMYKLMSIWEKEGNKGKNCFPPYGKGEVDAALGLSCT